MTIATAPISVVPALAEAYRFADFALKQIAATGATTSLALPVLQSLATLGLGGPARELLRELDAALPADLDRAGLRRQLSEVPIGRVPADGLRGTVERQLDHAATIDHPLAAHRDAILDTLRTHQVFRSVDGRHHLSIREPGALRQWVPGLTDFRSLETVAITNDPASRGLLLLGVAPRDFVERALRETLRAVGPQMPVYIVEPDLARVMIWLASGDRRAALDSTRVLMFVGPDAAEHLLRALDERDDLEIPTARIDTGGHAALAERLDGPVIAQHDVRGERFRANLVTIASVTRGRRPVDWADRLRPGATILGFTSRHTTMLQYSMRDLGAAFTALGYDFRLMIEPDDHSQANAATVTRAVIDADPALVVMINHLRSEQAEVWDAYPVLTWVQDPMPNLLCRAAGEAIRWNDVVCGYYGEQCTTQFGYPESSFVSVPFFPMSSRVFHDAALTASEASRFDCDIMYAGHFSSPPELLMDEMIKVQGERLRPLLAGMLAEVRALHASGGHPSYADADAIVRRHERASNLALTDTERTGLVMYFVFRAFDVWFRTQSLEWVGRWAKGTGRRFRLYGRGWERHPTLGPWAQGPIAHGDDLRRAYRGATLTLQTIASGLWHQRTFEALASGSTVLARYSPFDYDFRSREAFRADPAPQAVARSLPHVDRIVFGDEAEFRSRADALLDDATERRTIRDDMAAVVHRTLTYDAVLPGIIDRIRSRLREG
ncbi:MAG: glycosyltransferase family 1 protein [Phycisphaerales bacterium]|nr:glycosyltransferase family 1 protein [Phycisphaerales bacterium]